MNMDMQGDNGELGPVWDPRAPIEMEPSGWQYDKRRECQEIIQNVFLGGYSVAVKKNLHVLLEKRITHIVCVRAEIEAGCIRANFRDKFTYLEVDILDSSSDNLLQHLPRVHGFIEEALMQGGRVLIHGNAGISRSGSLLISYIMWKWGISYTDALRVVQSRRFCVSPNEGFQAQLQEYEPIIKAQAQAAAFLAQPTNRTEERKRAFELDIDEDEDEDGPRRTAPHHPGQEAEQQYMLMMQAQAAQQEAMMVEQMAYDQQMQLAQQQQQQQQMFLFGQQMQ